MRAGDLDQQIELLFPEKTLDDVGGERVLWPPDGGSSKEVWASRQDVSGMEALRAGQLTATVDAVFTIRDPIDPIDAEMRISHEGALFEVIKIARLDRPRKAGFEILARSVDLSGAQDYS